MKKIFINGKFLCQKITGVQRYAIEITKRLDEMVNDEIEFKIICPPKKFVVNQIEYKNIGVIYTKGKPNYFWEQIILPRFCKKNKPDDLLNFCNVAPIMFPGSCTIHDLGCIDTPKAFSWKQRIIYRLINKLNAKRYKHVFTVSKEMKKRIEEYYRVKNVVVTYNGCEHMIGVNPKKPTIDLPEKYFFSVGSMNPNKNFASIIRLAKENADLEFVISGKKHKSFASNDYEKLKNVKFAGYLSDEELAYMYRNCEAFLFPSNYEGFGIPPMEALVSGCKCVVCNDIPVLKEIYRKYCIFIDFNSENVTLDFEKKYDNDIEKVFNWQITGKIIFETILK